MLRHGTQSPQVVHLRRDLRAQGSCLVDVEIRDEAGLRPPARDVERLVG